MLEFVFTFLFFVINLKMTPRQSLVNEELEWEVEHLEDLEWEGEEAENLEEDEGYSDGGMSQRKRKLIQSKRLKKKN